MMNEILKHSRNDKIEFEKEAHVYLFDGEVYFDGVTGWIGQYAEPFNAEEIAQKLSYFRDQTPEEILQEWKDARLYGDFVHENAELWVNDGLEMDIPELKQIQECLKDLGLTPIVSEWIVYDEDIQRASAIDLLCVDDQGKYVIADIKTTEKDIAFTGYKDRMMFPPLEDLPDSKYYKYCLQVNIYQRWLREKYKLDLASNHYILRVRNSFCEPISIMNLQDKVQLLYEDLKKAA